MGEEVEKLVERWRRVGWACGHEQASSALLEAAAEAERLQGERDQLDGDLNVMAQHANALSARSQAAEAQAEAMRKALEPFADAYDGCCDGTEDDSWCAWESPLAMATEYGHWRMANAAYAAYASSTPERSLEVSVDESAARRPSDVCDQPLRAALEALQDIERLSGARHGEDLGDAVDAIWRIAGSAITRAKAGQPGRCLVCDEWLMTGPFGVTDCPACNPDPARG